MIKWLVLISFLFVSCTQKDTVVFSDPWYLDNRDDPVISNGDLQWISAENSLDEMTKILQEKSYKKAVLTPYLQGVLPVNFFREHSQVNFIILETDGVEGMDNVTAYSVNKSSLYSEIAHEIASGYQKEQGNLALFFYTGNTAREEMLTHVVAELDELSVEYSLCRLEKSDGRNKIRNYIEKAGEISFAVLMASKFNSFIYELFDGREVVIMTESGDFLAAVDPRIKYSVETDKIGFIEGAIEGDSEKTTIVLKKY